MHCNETACGQRQRRLNEQQQQQPLMTMLMPGKTRTAFDCWRNQLRGDGGDGCGGLTGPHIRTVGRCLFGCWGMSCAAGELVAVDPVVRREDEDVVVDDVHEDEGDVVVTAAVAAGRTSDSQEMRNPVTESPPTACLSGKDFATAVVASDCHSRRCIPFQSLGLCIAWIGRDNAVVVAVVVVVAAAGLRDSDGAGGDGTEIQ